MNWQSGSVDRFDLAYMQDFDDASSNSTIRLQVPDSPPDWNDLELDEIAWQNRVCGHLDSDARQAQTVGTSCELREQQAVSKTMSVGGRVMNEDPGRFIGVNRRRRPSSASSTTSSAGFFTSLLYITFSTSILVNKLPQYPLKLLECRQYFVTGIKEIILGPVCLSQDTIA